MNGEVIYFDSERGIGFASGADGNRYVFDSGDLGEQAAAKGAKIEFRADGDRAREIALRQTGSRSATVPAGVAQLPVEASATPEAMPPLPAKRSLFGHFRAAVIRNYANFRGRARRKEYWGFVLFSAICVLLAAALGFAAGNFGPNEAEEPVYTTLAAGLVSLGLFIPGIAVTVRRQHDIGLSGWFILLGMIPTVGTLILLVFALIPSQKPDNRWGTAP